jgi:serine/threonine-protein kinase
MATVYLAKDLKHNRNVALKVLKPELAAVVGAERFLAEIETTANLQHPHILPLFDSGEADSFLFYVMPYVEGETLRDRIDREHQLPVDEAIRVATAVANALQAAHDKGVIHRDIKPANILLSGGEPLVADFGIALAVGAAGGGRLTETGLSVGTPHYMSPEQATGDQHVGPAADLYALGCVLYEMLVGEPPHTGSTAQAILGRIITGDPVSATETRPSVPANVDATIRKALEKLPADRFRSLEEFAKALADPAFRHGGAVEAASVASASLWTPLSVVTTVVAAVFGVALAWSLFRTEPAVPKPVVRYAMALPEGQQFTEQLFGNGLALSPDGSRLVYVGFDEAEQQLLLWLRDRDQLSAGRLAGTDAAWQPFFSPDGLRVGFITGDRALKIVSLGGEPPVTLTTGVGRGGGTWSTDGFVYYLASAGGGLARVLATGGDPEPASVVDTAKGEVSHRWPHALPSAAGVLFTITRAEGGPAIGVLDVATGNHDVLVQGVLAHYAPTGHLLFVREDGALLAAPFDQHELALTGPTTPLLDGVVVASNPSADLALSESGTLMYVVGAEPIDPDDMVWVTWDGVMREVDPGWTANFSPIAISPDGGRLAVTIYEQGSANRQVWVKQLDDGPLAKLTFEGTINRDPTWTPDGQSVVFVSNRTGNRDLYMKRADGSSPAQLLLDLDAPIGQPVWSADGGWIAFTAQGESADVYGFRPAADTAAVPLVVDSQANEFFPALSPDGRWLAYTSDESGREEVYVRPFPNVDDARWLVSTEGGRQPQWAIDSRELFYRGPAPEMIAVEVSEAPTFVTGQRRVLFPWGNLDDDRWDVAPDGRGFMFARYRGVERFDQLIVVENFFEEVKRLVPN